MSIDLKTIKPISKLARISVDEQRAEKLAGDFIASTKKDYSSIRESYKAREKKKNNLNLEEARKRKFSEYWNSYVPLKPKFTGKKTLKNFPLAELVDYLDWGPFFHTWELKGKFPGILKNNKYGDQAKILYNDAKALLREVIEKNREPLQIFADKKNNVDSSA